MLLSLLSRLELYCLILSDIFHFRLPPSAKRGSRKLGENEVPRILPFLPSTSVALLLPTAFREVIVRLVWPFPVSPGSD